MNTLVVFLFFGLLFSIFPVSRVCLHVNKEFQTMKLAVPLSVFGTVVGIIGSEIVEICPAEGTEVDGSCHGDHLDLACRILILIFTFVEGRWRRWRVIPGETHFWKILAGVGIVLAVPYIPVIFVGTALAHDSSSRGVSVACLMSCFRSRHNVPFFGCSGPVAVFSRRC